MEVTVNATKDQIEEFKDSILWADIVRELRSWKRGFDIEQDSIVDDAVTENLSTASVLLHLGDLGGRKKAVDYMLSMLNVFLQILEDKKDDNRRNSTD